MRALLVLLLLVPSSRTVTVVSTLPGHGRVVALTFDAGSDRGYAARILATLEANHIHASFGMTGLWAQSNPDMVRRMVRDGDVLIDHTYDHRSFTGLSTHAGPLSTAQRSWEIEQMEVVVKRITGHSVGPYFRPPFGDYDAATVQLLGRLGFRYMVMWTVDSLGWDFLPAQAIVQRCLDRTAPGTILLMHVGIQSQDAIALPTVIKGLRARGYRFVTVAQVLPVR